MYVILIASGASGFYRQPVSFFLTHWVKKNLTGCYIIND